MIAACWRGMDLNRVLPFILPALFLAQSLKGLAVLLSPKRRLRALKAIRLKKAGKSDEAKALLAGKSPPAVTAEERPELRRIRLSGAFWLLFGLGGAWITGFSAGWAGFQFPVQSLDGSAELERLIEDRCASFVRGGGNIGLAAAVISGTNRAIMTFGRPAVNSRAPIDGETFFEIGSITKTFTGLALAREIERGAVRLDQPVRELLPDDCQFPEKARGITLEHLTTHTSGMPRLPKNMSALSFLRAAIGGGDPYADYSEARFFDALRHLELHAGPGEQAAYSNFGVGLLGYVLARNSGTNYSQFIRRNVCRPLGMDETVARLSADQQSGAAQGYRAVERLGPLLVAVRSRPWNLPNHLAGAGALRSTISDMARYLAANMHPEDAPISTALREAHRELFSQSERTAFAMNWVRTHHKRVGRIVVWHNGGTGGFRSYIGFTEDGRAGVVLLSNSSRSVDNLGRDILGALVAAQGK